jgi:hypothetical protein
MRANMTLLQGALALLLAGSAILFFAGSTSERHHRHHEQAAATAENGSTGETSGESSEEGTTHVEAPAGEAGVKLLGVDTESLALAIVAVVLSLLLAVLVLAGVWWRAVLPAGAVLGLVFAAGDGRELVHQLDESNGGLAAVAAVLIALHLAVALLAAVMWAKRAPAPTPAH